MFSSADFGIETYANKLYTHYMFIIKHTKVSVKICKFFWLFEHLKASFYSHSCTHKDLTLLALKSIIKQ